MKRVFTPLAALLGCALLCLLQNSGLAERGSAFVSQRVTPATHGILPAGPERANFAMDWDSVRTFRLTAPLSRPLKVYIETRPGKGVPYRAYYRDFVLQGMKAWSDALDNRLRYTIVSNAQDADVTVRWRTRFSDPYVAGITSYRVGHADVEIKTADVPQGDIRINVMHELGHALGIAGHSHQAGDIMLAERRWRSGAVSTVPQLSVRDVQAIRRLYSTAWQRGEDLYGHVAQQQQTPLDASPLQTADRQ